VFVSTLTASSKETDRIEVHDPAILAAARQLLDNCTSPKEMAESVVAAVKRNEEWRGKRCINLLAPEAPSSPTVRALLSAEVGTRAAEGHIGSANRWFAGTKHISHTVHLCSLSMGRHRRKLLNQDLHT
jgi:glycine hydroxymethyltransferase